MPVPACPAAALRRLPHMRHQLLATPTGLRQVILVLDSGEEACSAITSFAAHQEITSASLTAIGGFAHAAVGWFDIGKKKYRRIDVDEQCEVLAFTGDIVLGDQDSPTLHAHVVVGLRNGRTRGGHFLRGLVRPTLEVMLTETPATLHRRLRPDVGAALIDLGDTISLDNTVEDTTMAQVKDPVCGMMIDPLKAAGTSTWKGVTYYFCSEDCKRQFDNDPEHYVEPEVGPVTLSDEPPFTRTGPLVAPKFGSAGSGGAEYEPGPER
ncbi:MAG: PCC domain-containing protein [Gemmatimonadales bacterium]